MLKRIKQILLDYSNPHQFYLKKSIKELSKKCGSINTMIDIGCGNSPFIDKFLAKNIILTDIEKRGDVDFISDAQALPIKNDYLDLVLFTEVLEHIKDENFTLFEIYRIIKPGGWFVISVPFLFGIHERVDYRRWTDQGLRMVLETHGFKIIDFIYKGGIFSTLLVIWRNIPRELLGGNFRSVMAKILFPAIVFNFILCLILTPIAILLDKLDKKKLSSTGYTVLCQKQT